MANTDIKEIYQHLEQFQAGTPIASYEYVLTLSRVLAHLESLHIDHPDLQLKSMLNIQYVPPSVLDLDSIKTREIWQLLQWLVDVPHSVNTRYSCKMLGQCRIGDRIIVTGEFSNRFCRKDLEFLTATCISKRPNGEELYRCESTYSWSKQIHPEYLEAFRIKRKKIIDAINDSKTTITSSDCIAQSIGKTIDKSQVQIGEQLWNFIQPVTYDSIQQYSGWPELKWYHTDPEISIHEGFPGTLLMMSVQGVSYLSNFCAITFGKDWFNSGELAVNFSNPVYAGLNMPPVLLRAEATVIEVQHIEDGTILKLNVSLSNTAGQKVTSGTATCKLS